MTWHPSWGAWRDGHDTCFRVWAPTTTTVTLDVHTGDGPVAPVRCLPAPDGSFTARVGGLATGARYRYRLDGQGPYPDPASRYQPDGVHGPSATVDPSAFRWSDAGWTGRRPDELIFYELHVGTFSPEGSFKGVTERLPWLADLGITAVELMPLGDFAGSRNWGYDGVSLFAPARCYGHPDDLRRLVDTAHGLGLAVFLDVVYNHLGPDGAYAWVFSPYYFSGRHKTPWGDGVNLDGEHSGVVRDIFIESALHWVHEYHIDGLRLDATHAMADESPTHFLAELAARVRGSVVGRDVVVIAEDSRNLDVLVRPPSSQGYGLDAVWADDFHHQVRRLLAGDHESYYRDFTGSVGDLARTIDQGWFFTGQYSSHHRGPRGTATTGLAYDRFVVCLQNHDQVGNRAFGERLHHQIDLAAWRAASVLLLCAPETPLLFMGQEWAAGSPFLFFTDHHDELGSLVTEGRRREFRDFTAFRDLAARERIPDPQALATFSESKLRWDEPEREPHTSALAFYKAVLALRRREPALRDPRREGTSVAPNEPGTVLMRRDAPDGSAVLVVACLAGSTSLALSSIAAAAHPAGARWEVSLTTEEAPFSPDPVDITMESHDDVDGIAFARPGAVILRLRPA